ncbi:Aste57867_13554 [Aphanomyces stellatus]|uniref:Aste57867_13554 protein n=1 Tax=Aphanomyces stellatus TaxID=120398 RepID=A0A485KZ59_9STRA|nr:hypothetical protein As57867_013504 [Aphanomyces stellatus]VFT90392.1 Aste57867_13554 [Aphanomyces stellatus]
MSATAVAQAVPYAQDVDDSIDPHIVVCEPLPTEYSATLEVEYAKSIFGKSKFTSKQCRVRGQQLQLIDQTSGAVELAIATTHCLLVELAPAKKTFKLVDMDAKTLAVFHFPIDGVRVKLMHVLHLSRESAFWALPSASDFDDLVEQSSARVDIRFTVMPTNMGLRL